MSTMTVSFPGGKRVDAEYGGYTIRTDQPPQGGGEGTALPPFDLFLASIATCAGIYVLGFCRQRGLPTDGIRLVQRMEVDPVTHMTSKIALEIQVVQQRGDAPQRLIPAKASRIRQHAGFNAQDMFPQALACDPLADQVPGFFTGW